MFLYRQDYIMTEGRCKGRPETGRRIPVPYLQRMKINHVAAVYIQEQIGTGNPEKVPYHQIRIPDRLQRGKTVKYIEGIAFFLYV